MPASRRSQPAARASRRTHPHRKPNETTVKKKRHVPVVEVVQKDESGEECEEDDADEKATEEDEDTSAEESEDVREDWERDPEDEDSEEEETPVPQPPPQVPSRVSYGGIYLHNPEHFQNSDDEHKGIEWSDEDVGETVDADKYADYIDEPAEDEMMELIKEEMRLRHREKREERRRQEGRDGESSDSDDGYDPEEELQEEIAEMEMMDEYGRGDDYWD